MSRTVILYFTEQGEKLAEYLEQQLPGMALRPPKGELMETAAKWFSQVDALVFIGACGIAVRAIAPLIASKVSDPAVIVLDEQGRHVISLLSGHIGGANALAKRIAKLTGGEAVITTATDVENRFSADAWAAAHDCAIDSMETAQTYAAQILRRDLPLYTAFDVEGELPGGVYPGGCGDLGLTISVKEKDPPFDETLRLIPRIMYLGVGCRRGTPKEKIEAAIRHALELNGIDKRAVCAAASIDVKKDEAGLIACCAEHGWPLTFYSAGELRAVRGTFSASDYVLKTVGVDNVCERAAMALAGEDAKLLIKKMALDGVTVAAAQKKWSVSFE